LRRFTATTIETGLYGFLNQVLTRAVSLLMQVSAQKGQSDRSGTISVGVLKSPAIYA